MGGRGQVYVLDMGEPVRILDLAQQMIRLSGQGRVADPDHVHRRRGPGEKMHEVLWNEDEAVGPTSHPKIMRAAQAADRRRRGSTASSRELERLLDEGDTLGVVARLGCDRRASRCAPAATPSSKTRCTESHVPSQFRPPPRLRCVGGGPRRPEPRAAARGRGRARAGLHPRRRRARARRRRSRGGSPSRSRRAPSRPREIMAVTFTDKAAGS